MNLNPSNITSVPKNKLIHNQKYSASPSLTKKSETLSYHPALERFPCTSSPSSWHLQSLIRPDKGRGPTHPSVVLSQTEPEIKQVLDCPTIHPAKLTLWTPKCWLGSNDYPFQLGDVLGSMMLNVNFQCRHCIYHRPTTSNMFTNLTLVFWES